MDVSIVGVRGIPGNHGGFETFAERLALYLVKRGWVVTVFCQGSSTHAVEKDRWKGVQRLHIPIRSRGALGTIEFDWRCISLLLASKPQVVLTLGYNTAVFNSRLRFRGIRNIINMDGIEWKRGKWGWAARLWFIANEWAGAKIADHLVADHPEIARHLDSRHGVLEKLSVIPYGADVIDSAEASHLGNLGVFPKRFFSVIARPEPENSILEIVEGYSRRPRANRLLILGVYDRANAYHRAVMAAASEGVIFAGAIYDRRTLDAIRFLSLAYIHGHTVGGTNPSLVEAMGAGSAVIAHDNAFNRWVASEAALYFGDAEGVDSAISRLESSENVAARLGEQAVLRHSEVFLWDGVLAAYEDLLK